ncbi:MAG: aspartate carbamoyltransferase catalytic subunit [Proteobacteria bacterium]|nr:aspartate carbamoyltransferase catalytic subunit [Pseudomonadota bacterium]
MNPTAGSNGPPQRRPDGSLRHLLTLESLSRTELEQLLERAQGFVRPVGERPARSAALAGYTVANLFTEPSTRTRVSFELAAKRLGAQVVNLELQLSSRLKGESMLDTVYTLQAMQVDAFVIRDAEAGVPQAVAANVAPHVSVLSAGEAHVSHPTQGLLDALTIRQRKGRFEGLSMAIIGDIRHSRVARSAWHALRTLGVRDLRIAGPAALMPDATEFAGCSRHTDLTSALAGTDVVMMLRIQKERMGEADLPDAAQYFAAWGLTRERLAAARTGAIVMHPQPMNRGIEIESEVADGPQSVIRDQVRNGVAVRMAVLETVLTPRGAAA